MSSTTYYNLNFLNQYFTSKEFNFINNVSIGNQDLDNLIEKETKIRDVIINFINSLENSISELDHSNDNLELLSEIQDIFTRVNDNLKMMHTLKTSFSEISDKIVNLLIKIESSNSQPDFYFGEIQEIKEMINSFTIKDEEMQSQISFNDTKIKLFFNKDIVKKLLSDYNIVSPFQNENKTKTTNVEPSIEPEDIENENHTLLVSEKNNKVYLPYTKSEISLYLEQYPESYSSFSDVVKSEFIFPLDYYMNHPVIARFREAYSLIKDREAKSVIDALKYAFNLMLNYDLNPVIIAACKTQEQLEHYLSCLKKNKLDEFTDFEIKFEVSLRKK